MNFFPPTQCQSEKWPHRDQTPARATRTNARSTTNFSDCLELLAFCDGYFFLTHRQDHGFTKAARFFAFAIRSFQNLPFNVQLALNLKMCILQQKNCASFPQSTPNQAKQKFAQMWNFLCRSSLRSEQVIGSGFCSIQQEIYSRVLGTTVRPHVETSFRLSNYLDLRKARQETDTG